MIVDYTGVGRAVADMLVDAQPDARLTLVTITAAAEMRFSRPAVDPAAVVRYSPLIPDPVVREAPERSVPVAGLSSTP